MISYSSSSVGRATGMRRRSEQTSSRDLRTRVLVAMGSGRVAPLFEARSIPGVYKALARRRLTGVATALPANGHPGRKLHCNLDALIANAVPRSGFDPSTDSIRMVGCPAGARDNHVGRYRRRAGSGSEGNLPPASSRGARMLRRPAAIDPRQRRPIARSAIDRTVSGGDFSSSLSPAVTWKRNLATCFSRPML